MHLPARVVFSDEIAHTVQRMNCAAVRQLVMKARVVHTQHCCCCGQHQGGGKQTDSPAYRELETTCHRRNEMASGTF